MSLGWLHSLRRAVTADRMWAVRAGAAVEVAGKVVEDIGAGGPGR